MLIRDYSPYPPIRVSFNGLGRIEINGALARIWFDGLGRLWTPAETVNFVVGILRKSNDHEARTAFRELVEQGLDLSYVCSLLELLGEEEKKTPFGARHRTLGNKLSAAAAALRSAQEDLDVAGLSVGPDRPEMLTTALDDFSEQWRLSAESYRSHFDVVLNALLHHVHHIVGRPCYAQVLPLVNLFRPKRRRKLGSEAALARWRQRHPWFAPTVGTLPTNAYGFCIQKLGLRSEDDLRPFEAAPAAPPGRPRARKTEAAPGSSVAVRVAKSRPWRVEPLKHGGVFLTERVP
jgi:hypothetical protein